MAKAIKITGKIIRKSANNDGIVQIFSPNECKEMLGGFMFNVFASQKEANTCRVGDSIQGYAVPLGENLKIIEITTVKK